MTRSREPSIETPPHAAGTPVVIGLIVANAAIYFLQLRAHGALEVRFALQPLQTEPGFAPFHAWQVITYAFLHSTSDIEHLLFNMLGLWMFGSEVERETGSPKFAACYFASVMTAALTQLLVPPLFGSAPAPTIGASGGIFGLLLAYALLFPKRRVVPLIPPIPMPAWLFATIYALIELFLGVSGYLAGIAHFAHLGGLIGSAAVMLGWRRPPATPRD